MSLALLQPLAAVLWGANALCATLGQLALKAAALDPGTAAGVVRWRAMAARPWLWVGIGCFAVEFGLWLAFVSLVPLSDGILLGAFNIVVVMLFGRWLFGERLSPLRLAGILLITVGVAAVGLG